MLWNAFLLSALNFFVVSARVFDIEKTLGFQSVSASFAEADVADPWRKGSQRVDGNDCANVQEYGEMYYNCATYYISDDLTASSCRQPCINNPDRPAQCIVSQLKTCCSESSECSRHGCCN
ncbi:unnamed protein product [Symbiodinium microadriaticum]|nr:unnamed protein product [Symbiodinium microadriaticum]CAE7944763.1 unnamed protein product [Symbiodinium sp. KB8]